MAFMFPQPQQAMTPEGISRQRMIANALMQQGMDASPVQHWSQGLNRVAQALLGGYQNKQAEQAAMTLQKQEEAKAQAARAEAERKAAEEARLPLFDYRDGAWFDVNPRTRKTPLQLSQALTKTEEVKKLNDSMLYKPDGKGGVKWITPPGGAAGTGNPYDDEYAKQYAKDSAKKNAEIGRSITEGGMDARAQLENLNRVGDYLNDGDVYQGPGAETTLPVRRLLSYVPGINQIKGLTPESISKSDAAIGLSNEMALMVRNPDAGLGMPGALSNSDRTFLQETVPGLSKSAAGNKLMIEAGKRMNKRKIEIANFKAKYVQENGKIDDQFFEIVSKWAEENPMFEDLATATGAPAAQPGQADKPKFVVPITSDEEFDALPSGAFFKGPDGKTRQKP